MIKRIGLSAILIAALVFATSPSQARWMNPQTGRFHTMDTFEGDQEQPLSLHKYLYCRADPVNGSDPSGHFMEGLAGFSVVMYEDMEMRKADATAASIAYQNMSRSIVFKIGAYAIAGGVVAGNIAMVLDALGPTPQQSYFQKYAYEPYFGKFGTCNRYATVFKQNNPGAAFVGMA